MKFSVRSIATTAVATLLLPAPFLHGQDQARFVPGPLPNTPRVELFTGFSYLRGAPSLQPGNRLSGLYGGSTSVAFNLSRYFGLVTDFSGFRNTELGLIGPGALPNRVVDADGTAYALLFGPRFSYRRGHERFVPFAQALVGGIQASKVNIAGCTGATCTPLPEQGSLAVTAGAGFDLKVQRHLAIRVVQAEYMLTRFADVNSGVRFNQNDIRLSSGLVFRFGGLGRPAAALNRAPTVVCTADRQGVLAGSGDAISLRAQASDLDGDALTYSWSASSGVVEGSGPEVHWKAADSSQGIYTVNLTVADGHGGTGNCATNVRVDPQPNHPPTLACSADKTSVSAGETVQITATGSDADNDVLTYSWQSTGGRIVGSGSAVRFDSTGTPSGQYSITGHVSDGRGGVADCALNIQTQGPSAEVVRLEKRLALHSIYFPTAQPRVDDPQGGLLASQKQTLVTLAADFISYLQARPDAHLILEGHADPRSSPEYNQKLSERRVDRTKSFLVANGVPVADIEVKAFGDAHSLTEAEVRDAVDHNSELSDADRSKVLANMSTIVLASDRRVDVVLSTTGQQSVRKYPFNAQDSVTLLRQDGGKSTSGGVAHPRRKPPAKP